MILKLEMKITLCDDGWVLLYNGLDSQFKVICKTWNEVIDALEEYFGWWDENDCFRFEGRPRP